MKLNLYPLFLLSLIALLFLLLLVSCKSKKTTTERTKISDTLIRTTLEYKSLPIENTYTIDLICDTITGKVKPVKFNETSGNNYANLIIENNQLRAKLKTGQSEKKVDTIYQVKEVDKEKTEDELRYRTPFWHWWAHALSILLIIFFLRNSIKKLFI
jgi:hypothetical protein